MSSILNDTKHQLGLHASDTSFDIDVISHINTALSVLTQLGVGPVEGYQITGPENQWSEFINDPRLNPVQTYVFLRTKLNFNPPESGFVTQSVERQLQELEYRINVVVDYG